MTEERDLIYLCKTIGIREDLVQAGGGNISVKTDSGDMLIKPSGKTLFDVNSTNYCTVYNYNLLKKDVETLDKIDGEKDHLSVLCPGGVPSIETYLHSLTKKYTVHIHPISILDWDTDHLRSMFNNALIVDYAKPGFSLAKKMIEENRGSSLPKVVFFLKHGLLIHADTISEVEDLLIDVTNRLGYRCLKNLFKTYREASIIQKKIFDFDGSLRYVLPLQVKVSDVNYTPDYVIYRGRRIFDWYNHSLTFFCEVWGFPTIIKWEDDFFVVGKDFTECKRLESVFNMYSTILSSDIEGLTDSEADELLNWDSEKYRKNGDR